VPIQEACESPVNFPHRFHLAAIGFLPLDDELEFYVPAWDTHPKTGNVSVFLWGLLLMKASRACYYFFFLILNSRPRLRYSTSSMRCLIR
jgi:hypothetical protein